MHLINIGFLLAILCVLHGCGGGGSGGGQPEPVVPKSSTSSLALSISSSSAVPAASSVSLSSVVASSLADISSMPIFSSSFPSSQPISVSSQARSSLPTVSTPTKVDFTAWIGESDAVVEVDSAATGMEFVRTTDVQCDFLRYQDCAAVEVDVLAGNSVVDGTFALGGHAHYALKNGNNVSQLLVSSEDLTTEYGTSDFFTFDNKLWLLGRDGDNESVIWSSIDGKNWKKEMARAPFPARRYHKVVQFNNQLWLIGGLTENGPVNDIWSSSDGINWIAQAQHAEFSPRSEHRTFSFSGKLWIFGGVGINKVDLKDVWSSTDGVIWKKEADSVPFDLHSAAQIFVHKNQLVAIAGVDHGYVSDSAIWNSKDGINWRYNGMFESQGLHPIFGSTIYEFNGRLWLVGAIELFGVDWSEYGTVWSSVDGLSWQKEPFQNFYIRSSAQNKVLQLNGELHYYPKLLSSSDNRDWVKKTTRPKIPYACKYVELAGQLYAVDRGNLWKVNDLMEWDLVNQLPDYGCNLVLHNGKFYFVGSTRIWSSPDGKVWSEVPISIRKFFYDNPSEVVSFRVFLVTVDWKDKRKKVWLFNESKWIESHTFDMPDNSKVIDEELFVFNNRLWFVYSYESDSKKVTRAYVTDDGFGWAVAPIDTAIINENFSIVVHKDELLLFNLPPNQKSAWLSKDGLTWKIKSDRVPFNITSHFIWNDQLMVIGKPVPSSGIPLNNLEEHLWRGEEDFSWRRAYIGEFVFNPSDSLKQ